MDIACMQAAYSDTGRRQEKTTFIRLLLSRLIHQPMYWRGGGGLAAAELQGGGIYSNRDSKYSQETGF